MSSLGIIGLGAMGEPIAEHLLNQGRVLYTYVRSSNSREKAERLGIHVVDYPGDLTEYADVILILVSNGEQCRELLLGEHGIFNRDWAGTVIISSTISPDEMKNLDKQCPAAIQLLDAPVSGGVTGAVEGTLVVMAAGSCSAYESALPIMNSYAKKVVYVGSEPGSAQTLKAINQMLVGIHMTATAEAMALGTALSIDPEVMYETISECAGSSNIFMNRMPKLINQDFSSRASLELMEKDTGICIQLAESVGIPSYLTTLCHSLYVQTPRSSQNAEDACAVIRMYQRKN